MSQQNRSSMPLTFTNGMWLALVVVGLIGVVHGLSDSPRAEFLGYLQRDQPVILRKTGQTHEFPALGVSVSPPDGWTYLSRKEDSIASQPTFVNLSSDAVLRLLSDKHYVWKEDARFERRQYGQSVVDWTDTAPRELGRLSQGDQGLTIVAITSSGKPHQNVAVADFCAAIRLVRSE